MRASFAGQGKVARAARRQVIEQQKQHEAPLACCLALNPLGRCCRQPTRTRCVRAVRHAARRALAELGGWIYHVRVAAFFDGERNEVKNAVNCGLPCLFSPAFAASAANTPDMSRTEKPPRRQSLKKLVQRS